MHLKTLDNHDELEAIETLQTKIWHFEPQSVTPRHVFIAAVRSGGLVLGALTARMLWLDFRWPSAVRRWRALSLLSLNWGFTHTKGQGFGYRLKMAQRDFALEHGLAYNLTFDPLMMNAA